MIPSVVTLEEIIEYLCLTYTSYLPLPALVWGRDASVALDGGLKGPGA